MANTLKNGQKDGARFSVYLRQNQLEWLDRKPKKWVFLDPSSLK